ncbi:MAG: SPOR domain-containing protein, partial [Bacteroidota bacterium]
TLTTTTLIGQQAAYYAVQIGAFLEARHDDFAGLRQKAFIYSAPTTDNTVVVFAGDFSEQAAAEKLAGELRQMGYGNAYAIPRNLDEGETASVIQLATRSLNKPIKWERYDKVGDIFALVNGNTIKIMTGLYGSVDLAKKDLPAIRKQGFKDAFIKKVNTVFLHPITEFESGIKKDLIPIAFDNSADRPTFEPNAAPSAPTRPGTTARSGGAPAQYDAPVSYDIPTGTTTPNPNRPAATLVKGDGTPVPSIRMKVKRTSVLELQKILKAEKVYSSSLDGYYGPGTTKGFQTFWESDRETQQARRLAALETSTGLGPNDVLQQAINELYEDPQAPAALQQSLAPVARAYEAYLLYQTLGPSQDVNSLMNEAIQRAFANSGYQGGFDYRSTYAYQDLGQLIQHLLYIHGAPKNAYVAPCWLFEYHQAETTRAYATFAGPAGSGLQLRACDQLMQWKELAALQTLATE